MPPNEKFVTVFNARLTNTSADGASMMVVSDEWQTLQPNRANAADVSFLVDASSQARRVAALATHDAGFLLVEGETGVTRLQRR